MRRDKWDFPYTADKLLEAAKKKHAFHTERRNWWVSKRDKVKAQIRAEGIEIDESVAFDPAHSHFSNASYRQPTVQIKTELIRDMQECLGKVTEHNNKARDYDAWIQVLESQGQSAFDLNQEDWLFFFGK